MIYNGVQRDFIVMTDAVDSVQTVGNLGNNKSIAPGSFFNAAIANLFGMKFIVLLLVLTFTILSLLFIWESRRGKVD